MRLERLTKGQVEDIYKNKMTVDFPKSELKPLDAILKAIDKDIYEPLGCIQFKIAIIYKSGWLH